MKNQVNLWWISSIVYTITTNLALVGAYYLVIDSIFDNIKNTSTAGEEFKSIAFLGLVIYTIPYIGFCIAIFKFQEYLAKKAGLKKLAKFTKMYYLASGILLVLTYSVLFF